MKKIIITCPKCTNKIKITNKIAKYRCPYCSYIYRFNLFRFILTSIKEFFIGIIETVSEIYKNIFKKLKNMKNTYNYMKQLRKNLKNDPNWSNYRKQQQEEKIFQKNANFFENLKNKFFK